MVGNFHQNRRQVYVVAHQLVTPEHVNAVELSGMGRSGPIFFHVARLRHQVMEERTLWTPEETHMLFEAHAEFGNHWDDISKRLVCKDVQQK